MEMDGPTSHRLKEQFRKVMKHDPAEGAARPGTTVEVNYNFNIDYYGGTAEALDGILALVNDPAVVSRISLDEVRMGKSLLVEMVRKVHQIERRIKERQWR